MKLRLSPSLFAIFLILAFWQVLATLSLLNTTLFPPPWQVLQTFLEMRSDFTSAFLATGFSVAVSFLLASFLGIASALLLTSTLTLRQALLPLAIFFQTMPIIAIAPLLVIYFGFGFTTVVASATIVCFFPVMASSLVSLTSTTGNELELFRLYGASTWKTLWLLRLPQAYLGIYSGLRVAAGLAVVGAVAGEFVAGGGLGSLIDSARTQQRIDIVFACLVLLSLLGLIMITLLRLVHMQIQGVRPLGMDLKD